MNKKQNVWVKAIGLVLIVALVPLSFVFAQEDDTTAQEEANKEFIREFLGVAFSDASVVGQYISPDFTEHEQMPMEGLTDAEAMGAAMDMMANAITDFEFVIIDMIAEGDKVAVIGTWTGTHSGELMGMPATGNYFEIPVFDLFRIEDGLITDHWGVTDNLAFGMAFGMIPPMEEGM